MKETQKKLISLLLDISYFIECPITDIQGRCKKRKLAYTRGVYATIAKDHYPEASLSMIGEAICRNYSTVSWMITQCHCVKEKHEYYLEIRHHLDVNTLNYQI
jgi:chromosomal replication initiation ATPase DnaA